MISSYGDQSNHQGIILHIIIVLHQRCLNCSECFRDTLCSIHAITTSGVTLEMVLLSIFFTRIRSTEGSSADCSLFILSLHALALHLAVKILLQIFLYEDLSTLTLHTSVGCISLQNASRFACYAAILLVKTFLIFDINHQQRAYKEVRPD